MSLLSDFANLGNCNIAVWRQSDSNDVHMVTRPKRSLMLNLARPVNERHHQQEKRSQKPDIQWILLLSLLTISIT